MTFDLDELRKSESESLLQHLVAVRARLFKLADAAEEVSDLRAASSLLGRVNDNLMSTAKLLGDIAVGNRTTVNTLIVSAEYSELRSKLIQALRPFPEARRAVAAVFQQL